MKCIFSIVFLMLSICSTAQSKKTRQVLAKTALLERTVFNTKDSATLESLFSKTLNYEHPNGKVESREQAIQGIIHNKSIYTESIEPYPYDVTTQGDSI